MLKVNSSLFQKKKKLRARKATVSYLIGCVKRLELLRRYHDALIISLKITLKGH